MQDDDSTKTRKTESRSVALSLLEALEAGDIQAIGRLLDPEATWFIPGFGEFDRETILGKLANTITATDSRQFEILNTIAEDGAVAIEVRGRFRMADGRDYHNSYHYLFRVSDGLITHCSEYMDTHLARAIFSPPGGEKD
jgi:hypothetical protein